jgi:hypothetical protein
MLKRMKQRLSVIIRESAGSNRRFAELLTEAGCAVSRPKIVRWLSLKTHDCPSADELWAIVQIEPRVSIDWLLGLRNAESHKEHSIDETLK